jgi:hypothetical protein
MKKTLLIGLFALMGLCANLRAQDIPGGLPASVFYLMPEMGKGTLLFSDKSPIPGTYNICAIDNTVRFKDKHGMEMVLDNTEGLVEVIIDNVPFLRRDGVFYRLDKLSDDVFLATKREVLLMTDTKMASYGMESNTTAVEQVDFITGDGGVIYHLSDLKEVPYRMTETAGLYRKGAILPLTKKNCIRCFPDKKAEIEAWFDQNKKMDPSDRKAIIELCEQWGK